MTNHKWKKTDKDQWTLNIGEDCVEIDRHRPSRWHRNGVGGLVEDRDAPYRWHTVFIVGKTIRHDDNLVPDGSSVADAKSLAASRLSEKISGRG